MKKREFSELVGAMSFVDGLLRRGGFVNKVHKRGGKWIVEYEE